MTSKEQNSGFYSKYKNGVLLLSVLLLVACQPPSTENSIQSNDSDTPIDSPLIVGADSVTMSPDYVLTIKPSRYQPSLGLQGIVEPVRQSRFVAIRHLTIQKVMVVEGEWVEKGAPLFIVQRTDFLETPATNTDKKQQTIENDGSQKLQKTETSPENTITNNKNISDKISNIDQNKGESLDSKNNVAVPIVIRASFSGRIDTLNIQAQQQVDANTLLLNLGDDKDLRFVATLPIQAKSQLSVGQNVNFTTKDLLEKFTGQVSKLVASDKPNELLVHVHVIENDVSRGMLKPDMLVTGRVDYGQIEVGAIVPKSGIHDADLSILHAPPYQSLTPLTANVWVIKQDQRLTRQPVEVINYDPNTDQYLIAGISNDSLICLADLPVESASKKVVIS